MIYALLGNPNSGKTALFNALCKTVVSHENPPIAYQEGKIEGTPHTLFDLPGLYSLKALTEEEKAVIEYLRESPPDAILNVVDITAPEKDLYLTLSLLPLGLPTVLVLTKADMSEAKSLRIRALEDSLGVPVVAVCPPKNEGLNSLKAALLHPKRPNRIPLSVQTPPAFYPPILAALSSNSEPPLSLLLEEFLLSETPSLYTVNKLKKNFLSPLFLPSAEKAESLIIFRRKACSLLAGRAFPFLQKEKRESSADRLFLSSPLAPVFPFLALLFALFLSFGTTASTLSRFLGLLFDRLREQLLLFLRNGNTAPPLASFITNGLLRGAGSILSLLPVAWIFSFLFSISRESGYTARAAYFFKNPFKPRKNNGRILSLLLLFSSLFPKNTPPFCFVFFLFLYAFAVFYSFLTRIFIKSTLPQEKGYSVLVPLQAPFLKKCTKEATKSAACLIKHCFSTVFLCCSGAWILFSVTPSFVYTADKNKSLLALIFSSFLPLFAPLGITDWRILVGLLISPLSPESVIAVLSVISCGNGLGIASLFSSANALSFFLFVLLLPTPSSTFPHGKQKSNSRFLSLLIFLGRIAISFLISSLVFWLVSHL